MRILHVAHNHPGFHAGGTEIFAQGLSRALDALPGVRSAFLGAALPLHRAAHPGTALAADPDEAGDFVLAGGRFEPALLCQADFGYLSDFERLLAELRPDVVHFHHVLGVGLEAIMAARLALPECRIVLTLHDFYAQCARDGLMLRSDGTLCERSTPARCAACLPDIGVVNFRLRDLRVRQTLEEVDRLIAPSRFMAERFGAFGLSPERIETIPNGHPDAEAAAPPSLVAADPDRPLVVGFFGHLNHAKGLAVLLGGARALAARGERSFRIAVHGSSRFAPQAVRDEIDALLADLGELAALRGPYRPGEVHRLMRGVDWVAVPSIWWENDPLVVAEAFLNRRPVMASDIGGMAERVAHEATGLHVAVGDAQAWADALARAVADRGLGPRLAANLVPPPTMAACAVAHLAGPYRT